MNKLLNDFLFREHKNIENLCLLTKNSTLQKQYYRNKLLDKYKKKQEQDSE